ncbi:MAG: hypothetical protein WC076_02625 [Terrimicrobiaceae bacterium]
MSFPVALNQTEIDAGLCTTLYRETLPNLPALVRLILDTKHIGFLFATQYADVQAIVRGQPRDGVRTTNREVAHLLAEEFRLEPFADIDPKRPLHWMSYLVPVAYKKTRSATSFRYAPARSTRCCFPCPAGWRKKQAD